MALKIGLKRFRVLRNTCLDSQIYLEHCSVGVQRKSPLGCCFICEWLQDGRVFQHRTPIFKQFWMCGSRKYLSPPPPTSSRNSNLATDLLPLPSPFEFTLTLCGGRYGYFLNYKILSKRIAFVKTDVERFTFIGEHKYLIFMSVQIVLPNKNHALPTMGSGLAWLPEQSSFFCPHPTPTSHKMERHWKLNGSGVGGPRGQIKVMKNNLQIGQNFQQYPNMQGKISNKWTVKKVPKQIQRYETQSLFIKTPFKQ